jgi:hypothetical protein
MNTTTTSSHSAAPAASMNHPALVSRSWNGTPISRRTTDGYVNATAMCKANNKQWSKYRESDRCQTYVDALAETSEIRMFDLIESRQGQGGGTWVHPQVAVDLARWISAPFAVWMDGWFLEAMGVVISAPAPQPPAPRRAPAPRGPRQDPLKLAASMLPALIAQRWIGDPEANDLIRGIAQHLLLSCDPLPAVAAVEGEALAWNRALKVRLGQPAW